MIHLLHFNPEYTHLEIYEYSNHQWDHVHYVRIVFRMHIAQKKKIDKFGCHYLLIKRNYSVHNF